MKIEYSYNRLSFAIIPEKEDIKKIIGIKSRGQFERKSESIFIEEFLTPLGFREVKEAYSERPDLFANCGPVITDIISNSAFLFSGWQFQNFLDKLINMEKVIWDKI